MNDLKEALRTSRAERNRRFLTALGEMTLSGDSTDRRVARGWEQLARADAARREWLNQCLGLKTVSPEVDQ